MTKKVLIGLTLLTLVSNLSADIKPMIGIGFDAGGDELAGANFTNGDSQTVTAGAGLALEGGASIQSGKLGTQVLVGYKSDTIDAKNGDLKMSRIYVNAIESYNFGKMSVGAGITYHITPEFSSSGAASNVGKADFDSALGGVLQGSYNFNPHSSVGLRATAIKYDVKNSSETLDASVVGLYYFHTF